MIPSSSLVEKSLVQQETGVKGEPRFWMLETLREYALERLQESGLGISARRPTHLTIAARKHCGAAFGRPLSQEPREHIHYRVAPVAAECPPLPQVVQISLKPLSWRRTRLPTPAGMSKPPGIRCAWISAAVCRSG